MSGKPTAMPSVKLSPNSTTPSSTATAGFTYVITVERAGPISAISAKKSTKASAVQTSPITMTELYSSPLSPLGIWNAP